VNFCPNVAVVGPADVGTASVVGTSGGAVRSPSGAAVVVAAGPAVPGAMPFPAEQPTKARAARAVAAMYLRLMIGLLVVGDQPNMTGHRA